MGYVKIIALDLGKFKTLERCASCLHDPWRDVKIASDE